MPKTAFANILVISQSFKIKFFLTTPLLSPGLPSRTFVCTVSSELIGFCFLFVFFVIFFFLCPALD